MDQVKQIHAHAIRTGLDLTQRLLSELLRLKNLDYARSLLCSIPTPPSTFFYNKLLQSYSSSPHASSLHLSLSLYSAMRLRGRHPNPHTFTYLFSSCASHASPAHGRSLHAHFVMYGFCFDAHVSTSLIDMYGKSGLLDSARKLFDGMPDRDAASWNSMIGGYAKRGRVEEARELFEAMPARNVISWTSMVSGYAQNGRYEEAVAVFMKMWEGEGGGIRPNEVTVASVLPACANLGALDLGRRIEAFARWNGLERNMFVCNALLEMYAKCGSISDAQRVFGEIGVRRNLCSWNSMIVGSAVHGRWKEALKLFDEMKAAGLNPDDITMVGVLLACTHGGLVDRGRHIFDSMEKQFSIKPKLEHYGCMVDLLGRAGLVREAYRLICGMPMKPDSVMWGALLGACSFHNEVELAEVAAAFLFELEPWNPGNYVILSNIYASSGRWDSVAKLWKLKQGTQYKKAAGYSSVEVDGLVHKFLVEDKSHPRSDEILAVLDEIQARMKLPHFACELDSPSENREKLFTQACA